MISELAKDDIEQLRADGLEPSVADIIRLNALGLKVEAEAKANPRDATDYLPRVAVVTPSLSFRQPTIGHEVWIAKVRRFIADNDFETLLAIQAFALSRDLSKLPDPDDIKSISAAVDAFTADCRELTRDQIVAALDYAMFGSSAVVGEVSVNADGKDAEEDGSEFDDWKECVAAGMLAYGKIVLFGSTFADIERLTRPQYRALIRNAYVFHHMTAPDHKTDAQGDYYATLDAIRERLKTDSTRTTNHEPQDTNHG